MIKNQAVLFCAWCRRAFDRKTLEVVPQIQFEENASHGICPPCKKRLLLQEQSLEDRRLM